MDQGQALGGSERGATHQLQVLGWLFVQVVSQFLVEAGQVLHLHLDPVFTQVVMTLELIPVMVNKGAGRQEGCTEFTRTPASVPTVINVPPPLSKHTQL